MSAIPGEVDTDGGPPMTVPLRHFLVGLALLLAGGAAGVLDAVGLLSGLSLLAHVHLLVAGWVCVTIMGAMVQFVPVWSNVPLHSRRLATAQLWLVAVGVGGMAAAFATGALGWVHAFGGLALVGFWTFVYTVGRTLLAARPWDVTERHFAFALACFAAVPAMGFALAMDYSTPFLAGSPVARYRLVGAHATLAVFGAVLTTVLGALYQLATMFTQTELHGVDVHARRFEEVGYPVGVLALATGRLLGSASLARVGGLLVAVALGGFAVVLARKLVETGVERTPMLSRYAVAAVAMAAWAVLAGRAWLADPLAPSTLFGGGPPHLLLFGVVGFVVLGTLYHVVPFIVWVHRYSDRLGYEPVPTIDDCYDDRLAAADFACVLAGATGLVLASALGLPSAVTAGSGALATVGFGLFATNMHLIVREHSPRPIRAVLVSRLGDGGDLSGDAAGDAPSPTEDTAR
ncbi:hypothetical protein I7X12_10410 [Halosimplex litoreum]|uniref:Cbb3-type cytochrome c oxidase subunit I n=1 Tax=Halosimplex litoreum TaxID=1198301 RepID=A0A7T3FV08_9EURY|nr:hypothetical protein [Halosimplex litoreum]QPV61187.1 hypothetical protein I7X12_10410 [Halosimplex litoreum]